MDAPAPYVTLDYAPLAERLQAYTRYAANIPRAAEQIRANLHMPMARTVLQYGIDSFGGLAEYYRNDVPAVFADVRDAALQASRARANASAAHAMQELADWLRSNLADATDDFALGADLFRQMLHDTERVDIPLHELAAMGLGRPAAEPGGPGRGLPRVRAGRKHSRLLSPAWPVASRPGAR